MGDVTVVDVCTPDESSVTYELGVLEELQCVFNPEMAYASYIPFCCLIGRIGLTHTHPVSRFKAEVKLMPVCVLQVTWLFGSCFPTTSWSGS